MYQSCTLYLTVRKYNTYTVCEQVVQSRVNRGIMYTYTIPARRHSVRHDSRHEQQQQQHKHRQHHHHRHQQQLDKNADDQTQSDQVHNFRRPEPSLFEKYFSLFVLSLKLLISCIINVAVIWRINYKHTCRALVIDSCYGALEIVRVIIIILTALSLLLIYVTYHWHCQLCGTGARVPLDFQLFHFWSLQSCT